jgi:hypothetical protein
MEPVTNSPGFIIIAVATPCAGVRYVHRLKPAGFDTNQAPDGAFFIAYGEKHDYASRNPFRHRPVGRRHALARKPLPELPSLIVALKKRSHPGVVVARHFVEKAAAAKSSSRCGRSPINPVGHAV